MALPESHVHGAVGVASRASLAFAFAVAVAVAGRAAAATGGDRPLHVVLDGRAIDARVPSGMLHDGTPFVDVVRAVHAVGGLLTLDRRAARVTYRGRTLRFTAGRRIADVDGAPVALAAPPYLARGVFYVPVATFAELAALRATLDVRANRVALDAVVGRDAPSARDDGDEVAPSPTQALTFATTATLDGAGLHARVDVTNATDRTYVLRLPSARVVAFVVARNGNEVWTGLAEPVDAAAAATPTAEAQGPMRLAIEPHATVAFVRDERSLARFGAGRYTLRTRLLTLVPLDMAPIGLGVVAAPNPIRTP